MSDPDSYILWRRAPGKLRHAGLERFAAELRRLLTRGRGFGCLLSDDRELRRLNRRFLGKDAPTDVLSFPASPGPGEADQARAFLGDIAISVERAARQARRYGHSLEEEICILMLHGVLHLLGMDHSRDRGEMARAETRWRKKLGLPASLTERNRP